MPRLPNPALPVHVFDVAELGIDRAQFLEDVRPSFDRLTWDRYDQMKVQLAYLKGLGDPFAADAQRIEAITGADRLDRHAELIAALPPEHRQYLAEMRPFRRRAIRKFKLSRVADGQWTAAPHGDGTFVQAVSDYRQQTRVFDLIEDEVTGHPGILTLLASAAETFRSTNPGVAAIEAVLHQISVVARAGADGHPAPEGVHQDGCDFILSALVIDRVAIRGGVSKIFDGRGGPTLVEVELQPGQGICQADAGTNLWHEITAISVEGADMGHRMILGIDLQRT